MSSENRFAGQQFQPITEESLTSALNELSRSVNIASTYGHEHPAVEAALVTAEVALNALLSDYKSITIGAFNANLTVDEVPVKAVGTLQLGLQKRLTKLNITGLKISRGITRIELVELIHLLSNKEEAGFQSGINSTNLSHIQSVKTRFEAVHEGETVALESHLNGNGDNDLLILDDSTFDLEADPANSSPPDIHVEQIVAFLKGNAEIEGNEPLNDGLAELASDPSKLGKIIMESVSIRQATSDLSGESLGDIILGSLRRTYDGLRSQTRFQDKGGKVDLQKSMLLLEKSLLEKMRSLTGAQDPALDRQIVQAIREMDEELGFEVAAIQYMEYREAVEKQKVELQDFIQTRGATIAEGLISDTDFPAAEWRRIVVESGQPSGHITDGLNTLTTVFERLEKMMRSEGADGNSVKDLLGQASDNLDDTIFTTKEKLQSLSQQLKEGQPGTIGGHGRNMSQDELLSALSEVAQELMQPITAITASLEMMLGGFVGDITLDQRDLLVVAANSGEHLKYLMNELIDIVGCPTNTGVDRRFHTTSDRVIQLRESEDQDNNPLNYFQ